MRIKALQLTSNSAFQSGLVAFWHQNLGAPSASEALLAAAERHDPLGCASDLMSRSLRLLMVCCFVPALMGVDIDLPAPPKESGNPFQDRDALEEYIHDLTEICDLAVEEIAPHLTREKAEALRKRHYEWKVTRDSPCAPPVDKSANDLAELECIAARAETWYSELEMMVEKVVPAVEARPSPKGEWRDIQGGTDN